MVDITEFVLLNVVDTCAVWNILSSDRLYRAARIANCSLVFTDYVRYECLVKKRSIATASDAELRRRLKAAIDRDEIASYPISIEDLQEVDMLRNRKRLSLGELSGIAFAKRTSQAFLTDDQKARKLAVVALSQKSVQTTAQLFGWLLFSSLLGESDKDLVLREHEALGGTLGPHLRDAYVEACRCRLIKSRVGAET